MPQFLFIELPSFRIKDINGHTVSLSYRHLGLVGALYQYVRRGLATTGSYNIDLAASIVFAGGETEIWTSSSSSSSSSEGSLHTEENLLLSYFRAFDSPGAYPIVDAMLLAGKPCGACMGYFSLAGKRLRPRTSADADGTGTGTAVPPFRAKFTPRSDRAYTPVFYLARALDAAQRGALWLQLGQMWAGEFAGALSSSSSSSLSAAAAGGVGVMAVRGQVYYLLADSPWYALHEQESMSDAEVAEAVARQGVSPAYWIGR
ncbi:hypothetical protein F4809DRAFT_85447 [Biscogniauxia mediterranea]|nr:hypothetical protein F4809DRAFT_85447 [Biscogniauxia mediterranea]